MIDRGGKKILKAQPKCHIADPALYAIFHQDPLSDKTAAGNLVESVVYKHIADAVSTAGSGIGLRKLIIRVILQALRRSLQRELKAMIESRINCY